MKKVFLENLPKRNGYNGKHIDWVKSIGYEVYFIYKDVEGLIKIVSYDVNNNKLNIDYLGELYNINISVFAQACLGKILGKITPEFKIKIGTIFKDNKRDITIIDRKYIEDKNGWKRKRYKYKCNKCGFNGGEHYKKGEYKEELWVVESNLLNGGGCPCCCDSPQIVVPHINSIVANKETHWMIPYFQGGYDEAKKYNKTSHKKIQPICPDCNTIHKPTSVSDIYSRKTISCFCKDGKYYPEKFMYNILKQFEIDFISEYSPEWIKPKRYDFYFKLNNKEYIIETDGGQHNQYNNRNGQTKEETRAIDNYKDKLAEEHEIELIRIDCEISDLEFIKNNILKSELNNLFDLAKVDWNKCEEFALSNLCKKACEIKRDNPDMSITEIGEIMDLCSSTICKYLKQGSKLGWCEYNPKKESYKGVKNLITKSKQVEIFKDGVSLGVFPSCAEISRQSEELFGIKLLKECMNSACRGDIKHHRGYTFCYIEENQSIRRGDD